MREMLVFSSSSLTRCTGKFNLRDGDKSLQLGRAMNTSRVVSLLSILSALEVHLDAFTLKELVGTLMVEFKNEQLNKDI